MNLLTGSIAGPSLTPQSGEETKSGGDQREVSFFEYHSVRSSAANTNCIQSDNHQLSPRHARKGDRVPALPRHSLMIALAVLSLSALGQNAWYWTQLPDRVASHFGPSGQPNSWMTKTGVTLLMVGVQLGLPWLLVGVGRLIRVLPVSIINIPNREYWFAPERREPSLAFVQHFLAVVAITASLFMMAINHLTFVANTRHEPLNMQAFGIVVALYLIGIALLVSAMWKRFRRPSS